MTDLTREQIEALWAGAAPHKYGNYLHIANLARQLLATMTALAEAQAAQALAVERCAEEPAQAAFRANARGPREAAILHDAAADAERAIRSIADPTGVKLLAELRAERDNATRGRNEWRDNYKALAMAIVGETGLSAMTVAAQARLYRPRAEAAESQLAEAQKRGAGLREAMNEADRFLSDPLDPDDVIYARDSPHATPSTATQTKGWMPPEVPLAVKEAFANSVWDALKADANDLRKQRRIVRAFAAAFAPLPPAPEGGG